VEFKLFIIHQQSDFIIHYSLRAAYAPRVSSHVSFSSEREESRATRFGDYNERLIRLPSAATFSHRRRQTEAALFRI
jgi:hypothetical protein